MLRLVSTPRSGVRTFHASSKWFSHHPKPNSESDIQSNPHSSRFVLTQKPREEFVSGYPPLKKPAKINLEYLNRLSAQKTPITVLTAYNYATSMMVDAHADITLIGDSLAQVALGYSSTNEVPFDEFLYATKAVMRGNKYSFVIADLPFGCFEASVTQGVEASLSLVRTGVNAVKIEGAQEHKELIVRLTSLGIPVVGHIGLTPQRINALSGFKVQGKNVNDAVKIYNQAKSLEASGAVMIVLECIPTKLAQYITDNLSIPTIGIGAGKHTSGQVLVLSDILGFLNPAETHRPKFVKRYLPGYELGTSMVLDYVEEVKGGVFPESGKHDYKIDDGVWAQFLARVGEEA